MKSHFCRSLYATYITDLPYQRDGNSKWQNEANRRISTVFSVAVRSGLEICSFC